MSISSIDKIGFAQVAIPIAWSWDVVSKTKMTSGFRNSSAENVATEFGVRRRNSRSVDVVDAAVVAVAADSEH